MLLLLMLFKFFISLSVVRSSLLIEMEFVGAVS